MRREDASAASRPETRNQKPETPKPLIVAHRGASAIAPENTLAAFKRAIADGAEGVEFDVRLSKDGVPVVHHDASLKRTGGTDVKVSEFTAKELSRIDVGSWFGSYAPKNWLPEYAKASVPTLAETLKMLNSFGGRIFVELKSPETEIEPLVRAVCSVIRESPVADRVIVKSFRLAAIPHVRALCPEIRTAALFAPKIMTILRKEKYLVDLAVEFGADEISVHYSLATKKLMKNAGKRNLPVTIWTADHPRWLRRGIKLGINAIITNDPARLLKSRADLVGGP